MGWPSDAELRQRTGGGSQGEPLAVLAGPAKAIEGVPGPYALRFREVFAARAARWAAAVAGYNGDATT
jgi:hypothetical protein